MKIESNKVSFVEFPTLLYKGNLKSVKHIVIHNSATSASAEANAKANYNATTKGQRSAFAHYYVDDKSVVMLARENWLAYHAGDKTMNENSIGIEICVNPMACLNDCHTDICSEKCRAANTQLQKFLKAERNAIDLIHTIMAKWGLDESCLLFHSDVKKTACPYFTKKLHNLIRARDFLTIFGA
jgi:N-acetylmuramoyl-L-alanine amidase CwlA